MNARRATWQLVITTLELVRARCAVRVEDLHRVRKAGDDGVHEYTEEVIERLHARGRGVEDAIEELDEQLEQARRTLAALPKP